MRPATRPGSSTARSTCIPTARQYTRKVKNAQEAHEAIRPAGDVFQTPGQLHSALDTDEFRLYELIWQRTVASQMADARGTTLSLRIAGTAPDGRAGRVQRQRPHHHVPRLPQGLRGEHRRPGRRRVRRRREPAAEPHPGSAGRRQGPDRRRAHHLPAGPLHRGVADQGARRPRHRPALDVQLDHQDHPGPWLRAQEGQRAGPVVGGVRRDRACSNSISRGWWTTTSPPRWKTSSTRSPRATSEGRTGSTTSTSAASTASRVPSRARAGSRSSSVAISRRSTRGKSTPSSSSTTPRAARSTSAWAATGRIWSG